MPAAFALPTLLDGRSPLLVALVAASLMAFGALYLTHCFNDATTVALLGTLGSLLLTALLGWMFVDLTHLTGFADEEAAYLRATSGTIDVRGLLLAGIAIGSLGVLDDVTAPRCRPSTRSGGPTRRCPGANCTFGACPSAAITSLRR